jgi:hypothetical protein
VTGDFVWLTAGAAAQACLLLTSDAAIGQIQPAVNNSRVMDAARQAGFRPIARRTTPDKRYVTV